LVSELIAREKKSDSCKTYIYSLPGNGESNVEQVSSPSRSSVRKFTRIGQVLVQTDNNTYSIQGQEIR